MKTQKGFTIIELVVVILLLGILTATALPRFMDVTDEAHAAVVNAVQGGLQSGVALYHAQWVAEGEPTTAIAEFGSQFATSAGYPVGTGSGTDDNVLDDNTECVEIFNNTLQAGAPAVAEDTAVTTTATAIAQTHIDTAVGLGADFLAQFTAADTCTYAYIAQFNNITNDSIPVLTYNVSTGTVAVGTAL